MKRQLTSILLFSALLMGGASTFVSCTDHESDAAYEVTGSIADQLKNHATEFQGYINTLNGNVGQLQKDLDKLKKETTDPTGTVQTQISNLQTNVSTLETQLGTAQTAITAAQTTADNALAAAQQAATNANAYTDAEITKLKNELVAADADLTQQISAVRTLAESNKTAIDKLTTQVNTNTTNISTNAQNIAANGQRIDELATLLDNLETNCSQMITNLFNLYNDLDSRLALDEEALELVKTGQITLQEAVNNLNTELGNKVDKTDFNAVEEQVKKNRDDIKDIKANVDSIKTELAKKVSQEDFDVLNGKVSDMDAAYKKADQELEARVQTQIDSINIKLNQLFDKMMNMLTGIELQATESPITGYENFSFLGAEAHILGAYYGKAASTETLGDSTIYMNSLLIDETSGENAGVVYATLNPSNVDFTGCTLKVVNSQGEEAPFTATVVKSNRVLKYGISRAGNSNLYAIKINLNKDNLDAAKTWTSSDAAALKDVAKNVLDKLRQPSTTRLNIGDAATTIARTFNNRLTAYALQAEQDYIDANNVKQTRTITSKLSLAATAIKPISYNFLKDNATLKNLDLPSFPTLQSKLNFNDYKFNWTPIEGLGTVKTSVTLKDMPDLDKIKVTINGEVKAPKVNVDKATISFGQTELKGTVSEDGKHVTINLGDLEKNTTADVKVSIDDIKINPNDVKVTLDTSATKDATYAVEIPMDEFNKIIDSINNQVGNMIGNVNGIVDKVKNYADIFDGQYIAGINKFIQKFENLLRKSNSLLQPAMFYVTSNGSWNQLAREKEGASYLKLQGGKASTVFVASSYSGEILAPAYKKYVHVEGPTGAHVTGVNLNKVIDGNLHKIGFETDKEGVYTITYEAVDYSGVKVAKTFYVKVVK